MWELELIPHRLTIVHIEGKNEEEDNVSIKVEILHCTKAQGGCEEYVRNE